MAARLMFYTFADESLSGCHEQLSVYHMGCRKGTVIAESVSLDYSNKIFHCFKQNKNVLDKRIYLYLFFLINVKAGFQQPSRPCFF